MRTHYDLSHIFVAGLNRKLINLMTGAQWHKSFHILFLFFLLLTGARAVAMPDSTVYLTFDCVDGAPGDTVCVPVLVENFDSIQSVQLGFTYDGTVLRFIGTRNLALAGSPPNPSGPNNLLYIWFDPDLELFSLPDGSALLELCFEIVGVPGESSLVGLSASNVQEISTDTNGMSVELPIVTIPCTITVQNPTDVGAYLGACGAPMGIGDGTFTITVFGTNGPFTYSWVNVNDGSINGNSILTASGDSETQSVPPGTYEVTIMDAMGGSIILMVDVPIIGMEYSIQGFDPTCFNFTNGRIAVEVANGVPPYSLIWQNAARPEFNGSAFLNLVDDSRNINSLVAGTYEITLIDANGCMAMESVQLTVDSFYINAQVQDATCYGSFDGSVSMSITGGNPFPGNLYEVTTSWSGGPFMLNMVNTPAVLDPGEYSVTISDMVNSCDTVFTFTVGSQVDLTADLTLQDPSCPSVADGRVTITGLTNGSADGPYTFQLLSALGVPLRTDSADPTIIFADLAGGTYGIVLTDGTCLSDTTWFTLVNPESMMIDIIEIVPTGCLVNSMTGEITVQASGGVINPGSDYDYSWNGGLFNGSTISNLAFGIYLLTVTDDNGCTAEAMVNVPRADGPEIDDFIITGLSCGGGATATVEVVYTEGDAPVNQITWSTGGSGAIITGLPGDTTITVTIRDENFCFDSEQVTIPPSTGLIIDSIRLESPTCVGESNGQITVFVSGGTPPITYIWSTGDTTSFNLLPSLAAGMYSVTVTSSDTCAGVDTTVILQDPPSLGFSFSNIVGSDCANTCTGMATLTPTGGLPGLPYEFIWESGLIENGATSTATGLCPGWQTVVISQDNICYFEDSVLIPSPPPIVVDSAEISHVSCHGASDGMVEVFTSGGVGPYTFDWSNSGNGPIQTNLAADTYYLTITDANLCAHEDSVIITEPDTLVALIDSNTISVISCNNPNSGSITVEVFGGTPGFSYTWDPDVSTGAIAAGLTSGTYNITVTDGNGCTDTTSFTLGGFEPVVASEPVIYPPPCFGELAEITVPFATGGVGGYTFSINGGQQYPLDSLVQVPVGFYNLVVTDSAFCRDTVMAAITGPPAIELSILPENPVVDLGDTVQLTLQVENTQGPVDSIHWDPSAGLSCNDCGTPFVYAVTPGIYQVTVWDSAGCSATLDVFVDVNENRKVYIPNVFTPNFDGRNDDFMIFTGQGVEAIESVDVYDRWGELMISVPTPPVGPDGTKIWDGSFKGSEMQPGVYVYVARIHFIDGVTKVYRGDITLVR